MTTPRKTEPDCAGCVLQPRTTGLLCSLETLLRESAARSLYERALKHRQHVRLVFDHDVVELREEHARDLLCTLLRLKR